jgi:hypothetical protein
VFAIKQASDSTNKTSITNTTTTNNTSITITTTENNNSNVETSGNRLREALDIPSVDATNLPTIKAACNDTTDNTSVTKDDCKYMHSSTMAVYALQLLSFVLTRVAMLYSH